MIYQCIYCRATYDHDSSYKHNAYDCPKQKGKRMKAGIAGLLIISVLSLTGCEYLDKYFPKHTMTEGGDKATIAISKGDKIYTFSCDVDRVNEKFINCEEVK